jgi:hypothetical protein
MPGVRRLMPAYTPFNVPNAPSAIDLTTLILRSSQIGKWADTPGEDLVLLAVENQSVRVGFSPAFEQQFQPHSVGTGVLALCCKPLDSHVASAHSAPAVMSYC